MPKNTKQINKKQQNAVQNLSADYYTQTPQFFKGQKTRAKFACNEKLQEMIRLANLLPKDFHIDLLEAIKEGKSPALYWYEILRNLSSDLFLELIKSREVIEYEKQDSIEYWENNSDLAHDYLNDLEAGNEITEDEFNQLINSDEQVVAKVLVDKGYFGENYSYREQTKRQKDEKEDDLWRKPEDDESLNLFFEFFNSKNYVYIKALERIQKIRDFLLGLTELAEYNNTAGVSDGNPTNSNSAFKHLMSEKIKDEIVTSSVLVSKEGIVNFLVSEWAEAIQGANITRLRLCEVCEKFFWAARKDTFACSKKHSKVRQMRLLRENWKDKGDLYLKARQKKANIKKEK